MGPVFGDILVADVLLPNGTGLVGWDQGTKVVEGIRFFGREVEDGVVVSLGDFTPGNNPSIKKGKKSARKSADGGIARVDNGVPARSGVMGSVPDGLLKGIGGIGFRLGPVEAEVFLDTFKEVGGPRGVGGRGSRHG